MRTNKTTRSNAPLAAMIDEDSELSIEVDVRSVTDVDDSSNSRSPCAVTGLQQQVPRPAMVQRRLTEVSSKYDIDGKGYLNDTEIALRRLDSKNKGFLEQDKVYLIMDSLLKEQRQSAELIEEIRKEHKKAISLRRGLIGMGVFAVLLAVANIGTSFVAVKLVKDMEVTDTNDLASLDGQRLGTTSKDVEFVLGDVPNPTDSSRRHLTDLEAVACANTPNGHECVLKGTMNFMKSIEVYRQFCPSWPNDENTCGGDGGVAQLILNCNGVRIKIKGGIDLPPNGPEVGDFDWSFWVFPSLDGDYTVEEKLWNRTETGSRTCLLEYQLAAYCLTDNSECALFATYPLDACPDMHPQICGARDGSSIL